MPRTTKAQVAVKNVLSEKFNFFPSLQRQPSAGSGIPNLSSSAVPQQPHNEFFGLGAMAMTAANGQPGVPNLSKKGPKAPPHRPGALPMPPGYTPGMDLKGMLNPAQSSSSFIDAKRGKKGGLVSPQFFLFGISNNKVRIFREGRVQ